MLRRVSIAITGRVQGVGFRAATQDQAQSLDLLGYVKNSADGRVLALAEGEAEDVARFLDWCRQGPRLARVEQVDVQEETPAPGEFAGFSVRY
jgi:acylphosphatase